MVNNEVVIDDTENTEDAATNICVKEKVGDEYLIDTDKENFYMTKRIEILKTMK